MATAPSAAMDASVVVDRMDRPSVHSCLWVGVHRTILAGWRTLLGNFTARVATRFSKERQDHEEQSKSKRVASTL